MTKKRILALILCLTMMLTMGIPGACASGIDEDRAEDGYAAEEPAEEAPAGEDSGEEEEPAEEASTEEVPAEEVPAEEVPAEEVPAGEDSAEEEVPAGEDSAEEEEPAEEEIPAEEDSDKEEPAEEATSSYHSVNNGLAVVEGTFVDGAELHAMSVANPFAVSAANAAANSDHITTTVRMSGMRMLRAAAAAVVQNPVYYGFYDLKLVHNEKFIQPDGCVNVVIAGVSVPEGRRIRVIHVLDSAEAIEKAGGNAVLLHNETFAHAFPAEAQIALEVSGDINAVYVEYLSASSIGSSVFFQTASFSIFIIEDNGEYARRTYEFYNGDTRIDDFTQILRSGETLVEPEVPAVGEHQEFIGWYTEAEGGEKQDFGVINGIETTETVRLYARFQTVYYVTFFEEDNETVLETRKATENNDWTVQISDLKVIASDPAKGFFGWTETPGSEDWIREETVTANGADIALYPAIYQGYWLYFDENDGGTGGGATYTPPQYCKAGANPRQPEEPTRKGFRFDGWYTTAACTTRFNFNQPIDRETTVYAKWVATISSYSVIVWQQVVTDRVGMADADKSYDFAGSVTYENVQTGSTVSIPNSSPFRNYAGQEEVQIGNNENTTSFVGFHLGRVDGAMTVEGDGSTVLNVYYDRNTVSITFDFPADTSGGTQSFYEEDPSGRYYYYNDPWESGYYASGTGPTPSARLTHHQVLGLWWSTIQVFGLPRHTHYQYSNRSGYYQVGSGPDPSAAGAYSLVTRPVSGTDYPDDETWSGLFGQPFSMVGRAWPSAYQVRYYQSNGTVITNTINTLWQEPDQTSSQGTMPGTVLVFLDSFILPDPSATSITLHPHDTGTVPVYFYRQNEDGSWPDDPSNTVNSSGGTFSITDKYSGFTAYEYRTNGSGTWTRLPAAPNGEGVYTQVPSGYSMLEIRFARTLYTVEFINGSEGQIEGSDVAKGYGTSMEDLPQPVANTDFRYPGNASDVGHYTFVGWFADPECTTYVFFDRDNLEEEWAALQYDWELSNYTVYDTMPANNLALYAGWFKTWYNVTIDFNGGTQPQGSSTSFWLEYGKTVSDTLLNQTTREGYTLVGWYVDTENGDPWNFDAGVTGALHLVAKWRSVDEFGVIYDLNGGSGTVVDDNSYVEDANAVVSRVIPTMTDKVFVGWKLGDTIYYGGDVVKVTAEAADEDHNITLVAQYADPAELTSLTLDRNDGSGERKVLANLLNNQGVDLSRHAVTRDGYELIGWSTDPNADPLTFAAAAANPNSGSFAPDAQIFVNKEDEANNILYAVWAKKITINYVVTGDAGASSVDPSSETFLITADSASGSAAVCADKYRFIGWFDNADCTGTPLSTELAFIPGKPAGGWVNATYYAGFEPDVTTMTIVNAGSEGAVFTIACPAADPRGTITVAIPAGQAVTLADMIIGESYTVTGNTGWSITSAASNSITIDANSAANALVFSASVPDKWLRGGTGVLNPGVANG